MRYGNAALTKRRRAVHRNEHIHDDAVSLSVTHIYQLLPPHAITINSATHDDVSPAGFLHFLKPNSTTLAGSDFGAGSKPNSITLSSSNQLRTSSEPASVMKFGFYRPLHWPGWAVAPWCVSVCVWTITFVWNDLWPLIFGTRVYLGTVYSLGLITEPALGKQEREASRGSAQALLTIF